VTSRLIALDYPLGTHTAIVCVYMGTLNLCLELISFLCCYCKTHEGHYDSGLPSNEIIIETRPQWNPRAQAL